MPHRKTDAAIAEEPQEGAAGDATEELAGRIEELERALEAERNEKLRAIADFQNYRRRNEQEKATFRQAATAGLVADLLPILDNFERTVAHLSSGADPERMLQGIQAVEKQLKAVLESQNVKRIEAMGQPFDPDLHDAIATGPSNEHPEDTVIEEIEPGYRIGEKVIRPARVKVSKPE
jgi:molecular chaperone GrpE